MYKMYNILLVPIYKKHIQSYKKIYYIAKPIIKERYAISQQWMVILFLINGYT